MATYVNDLRLKEIGTGESSGTWGTETNTNLELIGEALGFGTEAITTNADTHTTTVADGSTDPGRAMYLKYTGTLDSACTITIAPNTISRMHFIENATSGSQNIIISQGSGANVTIPAGDVKAVYLDGAGSGAAVTDAFASLNVVDLKVEDDLTVTDDATIGGTLGVTGIVTLTDDLIIGDGKTIGSASDVDAMTIASNGQVTFTQTLIGTALDISGDIDVDGTTNLDVVDIDGAVDMASTLAVGGVVTANAGVVVDNITIDGTEIDLSSGDLTIDVAGDIIFDAGGQNIYFDDDGTRFFSISQVSNDVFIGAEVQDKDLIFRGNDGGSAITALTLDMSDAGAATFNDKVGIGTAPTGTLMLHAQASDTSPSYTYAARYVATFERNGASEIAILAAADNNSAISFSDPNDADVGRILYSHSDNHMRFVTNASEAVRIDSSGNLLVDVTAAQDFSSTTTNGHTIYGGGVGAALHSRAAGNALAVQRTGSNGAAVNFFKATSVVGSISITASATTYNTSSDARLKDVTGSSRGLDVINSLNPVAFSWKADNHADEGLIAQEVEKLVPNAVNQDENGYYQMDYSKLVTHLIKGMQEQQEQIELLKSEILSLKEK